MSYFRSIASAVVISASLVSPFALAKDEITVEIPNLNVAEYHAPYVAVWLANDKQKPVIEFAVWYDTEMRDNKGQKWLKDLRLWWRRGGRSADLPIDGVTGATKRPGKHTIDLTPFKSQIAALPAGEYVLHAEAARELGGREVVKIPVTLPLTQGVDLSASGDEEIGTLQITLGE